MNRLFATSVGRAVLALLSAAIILGTVQSDADLVSPGMAAWNDSEAVSTDALSSAGFTTQSASGMRAFNSEWTTRSVMRPSYSALNYHEWTNHPNQERASHFAIRRNPDIPRSDIRVRLENFETEHRYGPTFYDNWSWELYNLRGYSGNWNNCSWENIDTIREQRGSSELMARGDNLTDPVILPESAANYLTNGGIGGAVSTARDGNFCMIVSETAGRNYNPRTSDTPCFHSIFSFDVVSYIPGSPQWDQSLTIMMDFLNTGAPDTPDPEHSREVCNEHL